MTSRSAREIAAKRMAALEGQLGQRDNEEPTFATTSSPKEGSIAALIDEIAELERRVQNSVEVEQRLDELLETFNRERGRLSRRAEELLNKSEEVLTESSQVRTHANNEIAEITEQLRQLETGYDILIEGTSSDSDPASTLLITRLIATQTMVQVAELETAAAERLAGLDWRVRVAEARLGRLRSRRLFRVVGVLAELVRRPWRTPWLLGRLREAWRKVPLPEVPSSPSDPASFVSGLGKRRAMRGERPLAYPGMRVAHAGPVATFDGVAPLLELADHDWRAGLEVGYDLLLLEPGNEPLSVSKATGAFSEQGIPRVLIARSPQHLTLANSVDLIVVQDPALESAADQSSARVLQVPPSFDDKVHNPIGWDRQPPHELLVVSDRSQLGVDTAVLSPLAGRIHVHGIPIDEITPAQHQPRRPTGPDLALVAKQYRAAYINPQLALNTADYLQLALELVASGTPLIAPRSAELDQILPDHYYPADTTDEIAAALEQLADPATRERHSVPARRHAHTHHTHRHRFEQLLQQLDIPLNPPDRISILLSTNRPDHIPHALDNITRQNWPNKELLLILHGQERFDLQQIRNTLQQLPYPTRLIPCPATWTLGDCLNAGLDQATGKYITKMDDDDHYGPNHLTDIHTAHTYSNAHITGKWRSHSYLSEFDLTVSRDPIRPERYRDHVSGATMFMTRELAVEHRFLRRSSRVDSTLFERVRSQGGLLYVTHPLGFIVTRNKEGHTWKVGYERFVEGAESVEDGLSASVLEME